MRRLSMSLVLILFAGLVGCAHIDGLKGPDAEPVVLSPSKLGTDLQRGRVPEPNAPYLPVVRPPEVLRVWVLARANVHGDLLQGYWWHLLSRDWAFEQVPTSIVQSPLETGTTDLPYSPVSETPDGDDAEFGLTSSNTAAVQNAAAAGAKAIPEKMKAQILEAIQKQSGGR